MDCSCSSNRLLFSYNEDITIPIHVKDVGTLSPADVFQFTISDESGVVYSVTDAFEYLPEQDEYFYEVDIPYSEAAVKIRTGFYRCRLILWRSATLDPTTGEPTSGKKDNLTDDPILLQIVE